MRIIAVSTCQCKSECALLKRVNSRRRESTTIIRVANQRSERTLNQTSFCFERDGCSPNASEKAKTVCWSLAGRLGRMFEGIIAPSKLGEHYAWCVPCSRDIKVSASGVNDVREHFEVEAPCSGGRFQSSTETHDHVFQTGGNRHAGLRDHSRGYVFLFRGRTQPPRCHCG